MGKTGLKCCIDLEYFDITEICELKLENDILAVSGVTSGGYQVSCQIGAKAAKEKGIISFNR